MENFTQPSGTDGSGAATSGGIAGEPRFEAADPSDWPGYPDQLRRARSATGARHAVTTAVATVGGEACVLIGFEFALRGRAKEAERADPYAGLAGLKKALGEGAARCPRHSMS